MNLTEIRALVADDLQAVDQWISKSLHPDIDIINEMSTHIIHSGGKRIRPLLVVLAAKAFGYQGEQHITLAAIVEFIHTATLLHDDVVDGSKLRRGRKTANVIWGNEASVLVGDYLFSRAFQLMNQLNSLRVMAILANASNTIAAGEVMQLMSQHDPHIVVDHYYRVIDSKTACLFAAATELGALIAGQDDVMVTNMANYGRELGLAFQIADDALDYTGTSEALGKNIGDDLAEGKPTLPLIFAMEQAIPEDAAWLKMIIQEGGRLEDLSRIQAILSNTSAIDRTYAQAKHHSKQAITCLSTLPETPIKQALTALALFAVERVS